MEQGRGHSTVLGIGTIHGRSTLYVKMPVTVSPAGIFPSLVRGTWPSHPNQLEKKALFKGIVQHFWKLAHCHDPSSHSSRFVTFNCRSKLLLDRWSRVPSSAATLRWLMEFLGFPHQTHQIHNQKTPIRCGGQLVTCTFTTLWDNNGMLRDVKQILGTRVAQKNR